MLDADLTLLSGFAALTVCELGLLCAIRPRLRGTTLLPAWWWTLTAAVLVTTIEVGLTLAGGSGKVAGADALRFLAAALTFCPMMAVLGAKRPQHRAWQFIVLSLWGVLAMPAVETFVLHRGQALEVHGVRWVFLIGLIGLGLLNWLPTRFWVGAVLGAAGQGLLFAPYLAEPVRNLEAPWITMAAFVCFVLGTSALWASQVSAERTAQNRLDRVWSDFRDHFGALWALRVLERVRSAEAMYGWSIRLTWRGFRSHDGQPLAPADVAGAPPELHATLHNLLRRFVSAEWIAKRDPMAVH